MNTDLLHHLTNVVERRGFAAALDVIEPSPQCATTQFERAVDRPVSQAAKEDGVEMTALASS